MSESNDKISIKCPNCGAKYGYSKKEVRATGTIQCQNCGKTLDVGQPEIDLAPKVMPLEEHDDDYVPWDVRREESPKGISQDLPKLFAHGFLLNLIFGIASIFWFMLLVVLVIFGSLIGLVLGLMLLLILAGWINLGLSSYLWSINVKPDWKALLGHGGALWVLLIVVGIPSLVTNLAVSSLPPSAYLVIQVLLRFLFSPIYGFVGRAVALHFEEGKEHVPSPPSQTARRATCPQCGATYYYEESSMDSEGKIRCQNCGSRFNFPEGPIPSGVGTELE